MDKKILERLCRFARLETHRRGEFAICKRNNEECIGNIWYPTGHSSNDSYISSEKIKSCDYQE